MKTLSKYSFNSMIPKLFSLYILLLSLPTLVKSETPAQYLIAFDDCMTQGGSYTIDEVKGNSDWDLARNLYTKNIIENPDYSEIPRIPKIIHRIWLGSPLPEKEQKMGETWIKNNPDWQYILWTEKDIENFGLENKAQYDASINWAEKSDIARYEILYRIGGLYVDTDFYCLKPFDTFNHNLNFYVGLDYSPYFTIHNSLIAASPGHPILRSMIDCISKTIITPTHDPAIIMSRTGPSLLTNVIKGTLRSNTECGRAVLFPASYFFPFQPHERWEPEKALSKIQNETHAIHYWHERWIIR